MFLYRRGIFVIDRYILYSSHDFRFTHRTQCFCTDVVYLLLTGTSYDFRFTSRTQCFCTDVVYLLLTGTFCIRLMTFVSPLGLNVSLQTWYIYYWQVHFVFVLWLSFHPKDSMFLYRRRIYIYYWQVHFVFILWLSFHPKDSMFLYRRGIFIIDRYILYSSALGLNVSVQTWYIYYWQIHFVFVFFDLAILYKPFGFLACKVF
jgi:hypothetical protein